MKPQLILWDWLGTIEIPNNAKFYVRNKLMRKYLNVHFEANQEEEFKKYWRQISSASQTAINAQSINEIEKSGPWIAPYAIALMKYFKQHCIPQCVVSNGSSQEIIRKLQDMKLDYFDEIIGSDKQFRPKPNPNSVLHLAKKYKIIETDRIWIIGDSDQDMEFAMHARAKGIKVDGGLETVWSVIKETDFS
ncbi:MAG: HAD family hydrolase [Alphaproteobacteria bacterium]|nr:MAG: HAD family hydrolase [Alphaproteobacteria bacterium]